MTTIALREALITKISSIDDIHFLEAIQTFMDTKSVYGTLELDEELMDDIRASRKEIQEGKLIESKELEKEVKKWLKEK